MPGLKEEGGYALGSRSKVGGGRFCLGFALVYAAQWDEGFALGLDDDEGGFMLG